MAALRGTHSAFCLPLAEARGDTTVAPRRGGLHAGALQAALERSLGRCLGTRRACSDDGNSPFGSAINDECRIDLRFLQSWAAISGAGNPERIRSSRWPPSNASLIRPQDRVALLFTPPFDRSPLADPGYIKGYPAGMRENGGQRARMAHCGRL